MQGLPYGQAAIASIGRRRHHGPPNRTRGNETGDATAHEPRENEAANAISAGERSRDNGREFWSDVVTHAPLTKAALHRVATVATPRRSAHFHPSPRGHSMKRVWSFGVTIVAALGVLISACSDVAAPPLAARGPSHDDASCPTCLSSAERQAAQMAIDFLKLDYQNPLCMEAGNDLQNHLDNGEIVKSSYYDSTEYAHTYPGDSHIYLQNIAFNPGELMNTLAHEESHHWGWDDPGGSGYQAGSGEDSTVFGDQCAGSV